MSQAIVKFPKRHTKIVKTPFIKEGFANEERVKRFKEKCYNLSDFVNPTSLIEEGLRQRRLMIEQKSEEERQGQEDPPETPEDFRE